MAKVVESYAPNTGLIQRLMELFDYRPGLGGAAEAIGEAWVGPRGDSKLAYQYASSTQSHSITTCR
jgi:hypothetical protein